MSNNVHNLQHIADECRRLGPLDSFSCFLFENHLRKLKSLLRRGDNQLEQLVNRLSEIHSNRIPSSSRNPNESETKLNREHFDGPLVTEIEGVQFKRVLCSKFL